ncbi:hypothetical protein, partial [Nostoc sp. DedQUE02]|uniref:hypothetical protein n=1 Tax=Nostoc sp. DedQUE02 TaxID=3075388 RepID=UPI00391A4203
MRPNTPMNVRFRVAQPNLRLMQHFSCATPVGCGHSEITNEYSEVTNEYSEITNEFAEITNEFAEITNEYSEITNE